jgi:hypothetical protein
MQEITVRVILHCVFGLSEGPRFDRLKTLLVEFVDGMLTPWAFIGSLLVTGIIVPDGGLPLRLRPRASDAKTG